MTKNRRAIGASSTNSKAASSGGLPLTYASDTRLMSNGDYLVIAQTQRGVLKHTRLLRFRGDEVIDSVASPQAQLAGMADFLRQKLKQKGHPSDNQVWIRIADGDWHPDDPERQVDEPYELRSWYSQLLLSSEVLSDARITGRLLNAINNLEERNLKSTLLEDIIEFAFAYSDVSLGGQVNVWASRGQKVGRSLPEGPKAKRDRAAKKLRIVCQHAEKCWAERPTLRGDRSNTAAVIESKLNDELESLGHRRLKSKTIADYIHKGIAIEILRTGQS